SPNRRKGRRSFCRSGGVSTKRKRTRSKPIAETTAFTFRVEMGQIAKTAAEQFRVGSNGGTEDHAESLSTLPYDADRIARRVILKVQIQVDRQAVGWVR